MGHRFVQLFTHLIFSTKDRVPFLDPELAPECWAYIGGIVENIGGRRIEIGGVADHIHLLLDMPPTMALSDCVRTIKSNSSKWILPRLVTRAAIFSCLSAAKMGGVKSLSLVIKGVQAGRD